MVGRRERFMQSNFESLSTAGDIDVSGNHLTNNSISNQYREGSAVQRNAVTIARAQSLRDSNQNRRREELQKRIEETRKKLQTVSLFQKWAIPPFSLFSSFQQLTINMIIIKIRKSHNNCPKPQQLPKATTTANSHNHCPLFFCRQSSHNSSVTIIGKNLSLWQFLRGLVHISKNLRLANVVLTFFMYLMSALRNVNKSPSKNLIMIL